MTKKVINVLNKYGALFILLALPMVILLPYVLTHQLHYKEDMWFHLLRIQEMNTAIQGGYFPPLGNVHTFGNAGQLVQGMYPSFTLDILVLLTSFFTAVNQVYAIFYLILVSISGAYFFIFKKVSSSNWAALLKAILMTYPTIYYFMLQGGQFGLSLAYIFIPFVFWGLYKIRDNNDKTAFLYIGVGVGLILLSHMASALFVVMIVVIVAIADLLLNQRNFLAYVKAGIVAGLVGLPTVIKVGLLGRAVMGVSTVNVEAQLSILTIFSPLWENGRPYFGITAFMLIGLIFVILTIYKSTQTQALKVAAIAMALFSTVTGYLFIFASVQYSLRFLTYSLLLGLFVFLLDLPMYYKKLGENNVRMIYSIMLFLALVPAVNSSLSARQFVQSKPLWQDQGIYNRTQNKFDKESFEFDDFTHLRTYIDYIPVQQTKTATKPPLMSAASKQMEDVTSAKSVRLTGFKSSEIKMSQSEKIYQAEDKRSIDNKVIPYQPAKNIEANKRTVSMDVNVNAKGTYDLPFWMYPHIKYATTVDGKLVDAVASNRGRMSVDLTKGKHHITITQELPIMIISAYVVTLMTLIASIIFITRQRSTKKEK